MFTDFFPPFFTLDRSPGHLPYFLVVWAGTIFFDVFPLLSGVGREPKFSRFFSFFTLDRSPGHLPCFLVVRGNPNFHDFSRFFTLDRSPGHLPYFLVVWVGTIFLTFFPCFLGLWAGTQIFTFFSRFSLLTGPLAIFSALFGFRWRAQIFRFSTFFICSLLSEGTQFFTLLPLFSFLT